MGLGHASCIHSCGPSVELLGFAMQFTREFMNVPSLVRFEILDCVRELVGAACSCSFSHIEQL